MFTYLTLYTCLQSDRISKGDFMELSIDQFLDFLSLFKSILSVYLIINTNIQISK